METLGSIFVFNDLAPLPLPRKTHKMEFVVNDETRVNDRGFILLNDGMQAERYNSNPVMLYSHDYRQVIGRWKDLTIKDGKMYLTPEFDEDDPAAKIIKGKVERNFLRGASLGLRPINAEYRTNPETGEECLYVTAWEWMECSICAIPSNASALAVQIYDDSRNPVKKEQLSAYLDHVVKLSATVHNQNPKIMKLNLSAQAIEALGLSAEAGIEDVERAILNLSANAKKASQALKEFQDARENALKLSAEKLVDDAIAAGKITADKKDGFVRLAMADLEMAKEALGNMPAKKTYSSAISPVGLSGIPAERKNWTATDWMQKDMSGLMKLKAEMPEEYNRLFNL